MTRKGRHPAGRRRTSFWLAAASVLVLSACTTGNPVLQQVSLPDPPRHEDVPPATQREHQRILAAYGGAYENPKLERVINRTVERLVAASERPEQRYRVTILNSPAV